MLCPAEHRRILESCTRPARYNGFGLTSAGTAERAERLEREFELIPDNGRIHEEWRRLAVEYSVRGAQVHEARLVAAMHVHGVSHILTFSDPDFTRYRGITILHPARVQ